MKTKIYSTTVGLVLLCLLTNCKKEKEADNEPILNITGLVTNQTECKSNAKSSVFSVIADTISKVEYAFDANEKQLKLKHINTAFNCCSGNLKCTISTNNDTIYIEEQEEEAVCNCNCLFDLDIEIEGVNPRQYHLKFIEPYAEDMAEIAFSINLSETSAGEFSVIRKKYPWGLNY